MSFSAKCATVCGLLARGQFALIDRQLRLHWRHRRVRRAGARPFVHTTAGHRLVCFPDLPDSVAQYVHGGDDAWELELVRRWLQPGDAFVDAGANLGLYTHAVAGAFSGRVDVLALEASPSLAARLTAGADLLGERHVQAVAVAVGAEAGEVTFHLAKPGCTTVSQSMRMDAATAGDYEVCRLPMRSLADLVGAHLPGHDVALVKIDVEGAEPLALRGAPPAWFGADGPLWLVEINLPVLARMGFGPADVLRFFPENAFDRWLQPKYPPAGRPPPRLRPYQAAEAYDDALFYNLVAVPLGAHRASRRATLRVT